MFGFLHPGARAGWPAGRRAPPAPPGRRPGAAGEAHPDYRMGCKRILLSNDYCPALTQPNVDVVTEADRRGPAARAWSPPTASSTRSTPSSSAPASTSPTCRSPSASAAATAARLGRGLGAADAGLPRHHGRRLPQPVHAARAQHRPRPHLGGADDREPAPARARRATPHAPHGLAAVEPTAAAQRRDWRRRSTARMAGTVWVAGGCHELVPRRDRPQLDAVARLRHRVPAGGCGGSGPADYHPGVGQPGDGEHPHDRLHERQDRPHHRRGPRHRGADGPAAAAARGAGVAWSAWSPAAGDALADARRPLWHECDVTDQAAPGRRSRPPSAAPAASTSWWPTPASPTWARSRRATSRRWSARSRST